MKAFEFPSRVSQTQTIKLPDEIARAVPANEVVRLILLVDEPSEEKTRMTLAEEQAGWNRMSADQFLQGYAETDSIYDRL